jgi:hypothetical protein
MITTVTAIISISGPILGGLTWLIVLSHRHGAASAKQTQELKEIHREVTSLVSAQKFQENRLDHIEAYLTSKFRGYLPTSYRERR